MERLLILNPGSTSTKLAVYDGEESLFVESIVHTAEELAPFDHVADQYEFRKDLVLRCLERHQIPLDSLTAIVSRGGLLTPIDAAALRYAESIGKHYQDITVIVAHLGGGITVNLHHNGRVEDSINDEEGPFSPERSGGLPMFDVIEMCFSGNYSYHTMMNQVKRQGGLVAHLGTTDSREVEKMIQNGDEHAKLIYDAMALNVAKFIAKVAPNVCGKVDAILLTGGIAYSKYFTDYVRKHVEFIAPVVVYAGEDEMRSLALGGLRVLRGQEVAKTFVKSEN